MPDTEEIYQNAPPTSSRVKITQERFQQGHGMSHTYENQNSMSYLESKGTNQRCTRTNMLLISLCVFLLCGITVLGVLYGIKEKNGSASVSYQPDKHDQCSDCWEFFNGSCYYFSHNKLNWTTSRDECVSAGGHLVVIDSREEQIYITQKVNSEYEFWIGLTDSEKEGHWKWVDNTDLKFKFWHPNQPNNLSGLNDKYISGEDCGLVRDVLRHEQNWFDEYCGLLYNRICEV